MYVSVNGLCVCVCCRAGGKFACGSASLSIAQIRLQFSQPLERSLFLLHCKGETVCVSVCVCLGVCVQERDREREGDACIFENRGSKTKKRGGRHGGLCVCLCVGVCVCVCVGGWLQGEALAGLHAWQTQLYRY